MRAASALALLLLAAACDRPAPVAAPPAPRELVLDESWSVMSINRGRVGYEHSLRTQRTTPGGSTEIESFHLSRLSLKRLGSPLEVNSDVRHVETPDGRALRFSSRMQMSPIPTVMEGTIENGRLLLKTTSGGTTKEREMAWDPDWLLSEGARLLSLKKGFAAGTKYQFKTFSTEMGQPSEVDIDVKGAEAKTIGGKERRLHRVQMKMSLQKGMVMTSWVDDAGNALAGEMDMMGAKFVVEVSTKEEALREAGAEIPEIFFQTMPRSNVALPRPRDITALTLRIERAGGELAEWTPPTGTQSVAARDAKGVTLRVESKPGGSGTPGEAEAPFLKSSPAVQSDDAEIVTAAKEIAGGETDLAKVAGRIATWVHDHIDKKSMDIAAASAREVFKSRGGDCSEHAVLLTAMLRAAGIPAKVCTGYLYHRGAWAGHAWTSAWLGAWIDFDATLGGNVADAARIKFSETEAEDAGALMEGMRGAGFMHGAMKVEILEYSIDGKTLKVAPPGAAAGARFEAPLIGLSFEKPDGWTFKETKDLPPFTLAVVASPDGAASAVVSYIDLAYDEIRLDTKKAARKQGAPSSGDLGKLESFETYGTDDRFYVRISPGELIEVVVKGDAQPALERFKKTMKITR